MEDKSLTICSLFYGNHFRLAKRCLDSIREAMANGSRFVRDFRLAHAEAEPATVALIRDSAQHFLDKYGIPSRVFECENAGKYPIMRAMVHAEGPVGEYLMWLDDDSYFEIPQPRDWWKSLSTQVSSADMVGQFWLMPLAGNQWEWIKTQKWHNPKAGLPPKKVSGKPAFEFCQGAWWVIKSKHLYDYNWPIPELRHNGGDSLLGELLRQQGLKMVRFYGGVRINADANGAHSKSKRRGLREPRVGTNYFGQPLSTAHQNFKYTVELFGDKPKPKPKFINYYEG